MGKKSFIQVFLVIIFLSIITISNVFSIDCGDVNSSGSVDIVDALLIAQCYVGLRECPKADIGDVDCSGSINIIDALLTAQYYVGLIDQLACCGTPDQ